MSSTPPERIRAARERIGLEIRELAEQLGLPFAHCRDLEDFEDEAATTISLRTLQQLARILGLTPLQILEGDQAIAPARRLSFSEFSRTVRAAVTKAGGDVDAWGEEAGWDVAPILHDSEEVWEWNVDELRDVATAAGVDWRAVLPE